MSWQGEDTSQESLANMKDESRVINESTIAFWSCPNCPILQNKLAVITENERLQLQIQQQDTNINELKKNLKDLALNIRELQIQVKDNASKTNSIIIGQLVYTFADLMAEAIGTNQQNIDELKEEFRVSPFSEIKQIVCEKDKTYEKYFKGIDDDVGDDLFSSLRNIRRNLSHPNIFDEQPDHLKKLISERMNRRTQRKLRDQAYILVDNIFALY